jgi:multidrug resistance efflux pump
MDLIPFSVSGLCLESYFIKINSRSKIIYWIIICVIVFGIAILPFVFVDVSIQARGYFQAAIEKQTVSAPFQGKIVYTSIHNGKRVNKGDTLLIIDSEAIRARQSFLKQRIAENNAVTGDLEKLTGLDSGEDKLPEIELITKRYQAEYANLRNQQTIQIQKYLKRKSEHDRNQVLYDKEIIPQVDYENSLFVLESEKDNLNQVILYQESLWHSDLMSRRNDAISFLADLKQCREELNNRIVLATISGEIIQSSDLQVNSLVSPGQNLAEISPDGDLLATCFVRPSDIGLIHEKQKVRIQVDAFNYNEWGLLQGEIVDISDDMIMQDGSTAFFRIRCKPDRTFLSLKNGHRANIKKGMSLNSRIVVIRRSIFNLLFDKADKWFNPYTSKKE